jgi:hypothetical protein
MKYKNIIKLRLPEIQLLAVVCTQLKFSIVKDHDEPTIFFCLKHYFVSVSFFNMGTELPIQVMLGQTLVLMQMTFLNSVRIVGRLVLSRTSCCKIYHSGLYSYFYSNALLSPGIILDVSCNVCESLGGYSLAYF